ncbi:MAG: hypothetical protein COB02_17365, partial [Candidatus Cloacimonadota bacterium]
MTTKRHQGQDYGNDTNTLNSDKYEVIKALGSGQAATVFLCRGTDKLKQEYAIKKVELSADKKEQEISFKEAQRLVKMHHRFLPKVWEVFVENNHHHMVMDYLAMGTLEKYLKELSKSAKVSFVQNSLKIIFLNLLEVMIYIHDQEVMHLDIKPDNILIDANSLDIRLIDFELSRSFRSGDANYAQASKKYCTHNWASPEMQSQKSLSYQSDIYSLGAILYTLSHDFKIPPEYPEKDKYDHFIEVIDCCLQTNPQKRYKSVKALKVAFEKAYDLEIGDTSTIKSPYDTLNDNSITESKIPLISKEVPVISSVAKRSKKSYNLKITTSPKNCKLKLNDSKHTLSTPVDIDIEEGQVKLEFSAKKHKNLTETFVLSGNSQKYFTLQSERGLLSIDSSPSDIAFKLNGRGYYTPLEDLDLDTDQIKTLFEESGYEKIEDTLDLSKGDVSKHYNLKELKKAISPPKIEKKVKVSEAVKPQLVVKESESNESSGGGGILVLIGI